MAVPAPRKDQVEAPETQPTGRLARLFFTGMGMGAADVVPGVSGGTIAFISGVYEELILSLRTVSGPALKEILRGRVGTAFRMVPWRFLVPLGVGVLSSVLLLAGVITWLLEAHPVSVWSFFFGLVLASAVVVRKRVRNWRAPTPVLFLTGGAAVAYGIVGLVPQATPANPVAFFAAGAIAISAMILPGISGSFLLLLMGKYQQVLLALAERDVATLAVFAAGVIVGLGAFVHVLSWLLRRHHDIVIAALTGLMIGSLRKVWPWKADASELGEGARNVLPPEFDVGVAFAVFLAVAGAALILTLDRLHVVEE